MADWEPNFQKRTAPRWSRHITQVSKGVTTLFSYVM